MNIARSRVWARALRGVTAANARGLYGVKAPRRLGAYSARKTLSTAAGAQQKKPDDDLFSRHGGKMILGVVAGVVGLLWRWIKGKGDATSTEGLVHATLALEPNEINDLRLANELSSSEYKALASRLQAQFPSGTASYADFIAAVKQHLGGRAIANGYLLDRIIMSDPRRGFSAPSSDGDSSQYALDYLLVALNLCMDEPALFRVDSLWHVLRCLEAQQHSAESGVMENEQFTQAEFAEFDGVKASNDESEGESTSSEQSTVNGVVSIDEDVTAESVARMVDLLLRTCQLPGEKLVTEDKGNFIPYQKHRKSTPDELIAKARKELKFPNVEQRISAERFHALLVSKAICAWGECYREKKE